MSNRTLTDTATITQDLGTAAEIKLNIAALGTPSSGTLTSCTGLPISTGITGAGTNVLAALGNALNGASGLVGFSGALGTPASGTLTSCTGLPIAGTTGWGTGVATALAANVTGSGGIALATSPSFTTPTLGVASATTVNKVTLTAPATGSTLTISDGKTLTSSNTLTLAGTDSTTMTFPASSANVAALNLTAQVVSGGARVTSFSIGTVTTGTTTIDTGNGPLQFFTNGGASTLAAPSHDGSCVVEMTNNSGAGAITFSGFTVGANTGDALTTTNTSIFNIYITRINGTSTYTIKALQ